MSGIPDYVYQLRITKELDMLINVYREGKANGEVEDATVPGLTMTEPLVVGQTPTVNTQVVSKSYVDNKASVKDASAIKVGSLPSSRLPNFNANGTDGWFPYGTSYFWLAPKSIAQNFYTKATVRSNGILDSASGLVMGDVPNFNWNKVSEIPVSQTVEEMGIGDAVTKEGSMMTGNLNILSPVVDPTDTATVRYVTDKANAGGGGAAVPLGTVKFVNADGTAEGYMRFTGAVLNKGVYPDLYDMVGGDVWSGKIAPGGEPHRLQYWFNTNNNVNYGDFTLTNLLESAGNYWDTELGVSDVHLDNQNVIGGTTFIIGNKLHAYVNPGVMSGPGYGSNMPGLVFDIDENGIVQQSPATTSAPLYISDVISNTKTGASYIGSPYGSCPSSPIIIGNRLYFMSVASNSSYQKEDLRPTFSLDYRLKRGEEVGQTPDVVCSLINYPPYGQIYYPVPHFPVSFEVDPVAGTFNNPRIEYPDMQDIGPSNRTIVSPCVHNNKLYYFDLSENAQGVQYYDTAAGFTINLREVEIDQNGAFQNHRTALIITKDNLPNLTKTYPSFDKIYKLHMISTKAGLFIFVALRSNMEEYFVRLYKVDSSFNITEVSIPGLTGTTGREGAGNRLFHVLTASGVTLLTTRKRVFIVYNAKSNYALEKVPGLVLSLGLNDDGEFSGEFDISKIRPDLVEPTYWNGTSSSLLYRAASVYGGNHIPITFATSSRICNLVAYYDYNEADNNLSRNRIGVWSRPFTGVSSNRYSEHIIDPPVNTKLELFKLPDNSGQDTSAYNKLISYGRYIPGSAAPAYQDPYLVSYQSDYTDTDWEFAVKPELTQPTESYGVPIVYQSVTQTDYGTPWLNQHGFNDTGTANLSSAIFEEIPNLNNTNIVIGGATYRGMFATKNRIYFIGSKTTPTGIGSDIGRFDYVTTDASGNITSVPGDNYISVPFSAYSPDTDTIGTMTPIVLNNRLYLFNLAKSEGSSNKQSLYCLTKSAELDEDGEPINWRDEIETPDFLGESYYTGSLSEVDYDTWFNKDFICLFGTIYSIRVDRGQLRAHKANINASGVIVSWSDVYSTPILSASGKYRESLAYSHNGYKSSMGNNVKLFATKSGLYAIITQDSIRTNGTIGSKPYCAVYKANFLDDEITEFYRLDIPGLSTSSPVNTFIPYYAYKVIATESQVTILGLYSRIYDDVLPADLEDMKAVLESRFAFKTFDIDVDGNIVGNTSDAESIQYDKNGLPPETSRTVLMPYLFGDYGLPKYPEPNKIAISGNCLYMLSNMYPSTDSSQYRLALKTNWSGGTSDYSPYYTGTFVPTVTYRNFIDLVQGNYQTQRYSIMRYGTGAIETVTGGMASGWIEDSQWVPSNVNPNFGNTFMLNSTRMYLMGSRSLAGTGGLYGAPTSKLMYIPLNTNGTIGTINTSNYEVVPFAELNNTASAVLHPNGRAYFFGLNIAGAFGYNLDGEGTGLGATELAALNIHTTYTPEDGYIEDPNQELAGVVSALVDDDTGALSDWRIERSPDNGWYCPSSLIANETIKVFSALDSGSQYSSFSSKAKYSMPTIDASTGEILNWTEVHIGAQIETIPGISSDVGNTSLMSVFSTVAGLYLITNSSDKTQSQNLLFARFKPDGTLGDFSLHGTPTGYNGRANKTSPEPMPCGTILEVVTSGRKVYVFGNGDPTGQISGGSVRLYVYTFDIDYTTGVMSDAYTYGELSSDTSSFYTLQGSPGRLLMTPCVTKDNIYLVCSDFTKRTTKNPTGGLILRKSVPGF